MTSLTAHRMSTPEVRRRAGHEHRTTHTLLAWLAVALSPIWVASGFAAMTLLAGLLGLHASADGSYATWANTVMTTIATLVTAAGLTVAARLGVRAGHEGSAWGIGAAVTACILLAFLLVGAVTSLLFG